MCTWQYKHARIKLATAANLTYFDWLFLPHVLEEVSKVCRTCALGSILNVHSSKGGVSCCPLFSCLFGGLVCSSYALGDEATFEWRRVWNEKILH